MRIGMRGLAVRFAIVATAAVIVGVISFALPRAGPPARDAAAVDPGPWIDVRWERLDPPAMGGPLTQSMARIVAGGPGLIAIGRDAVGVDGAETSMAAVWTSSDGRSWTKHRLLDGVPAGDSSEAIGAVAGPAGVVVWGGVCCTIEDRAMWFSPDGAGWERTVLAAGLQETTFLDIATGPVGFVAGGVSRAGDPNDPDEAAELWTSPDGRTWTEIDPVAAELGAGSISDVTWTGRAWFAVGKQASGDSWDAAVWTSPDGTDWERVAVADPAITGPDEEEFGRILLLGDRLFVQGGSGSHEDRVRCEDAVGLGIVGVEDAALALSCGWLRTTHWRSDHGRTWERLGPVEPLAGGGPLPPRPDGRRLVSYRVLATGGPGLVVVDAEAHQEGLPGDVIGTWVSADGEPWRPVGKSPQFPIGLYLQDMVVVDRTIIGIGDSAWDQPNGSDGLVWIGTVLP